MTFLRGRDAESSLNIPVIGSSLTGGMRADACTAFPADLTVEDQWWIQVPGVGDGDTRGADPLDARRPGD